MKMHDINPEKRDVILLLHPMFATAKMMEMLIANQLGDGYRYLIPDIAGHGEAVNQIYKSAQNEADEIYQYLREQHIASIKLAFGASLGGVVLMELVRHPVIDYDRLVFEGVSFYEKADFLGFITKIIMVKKHRKAVRHPEISVEKMGELYGAQVAQPMAEQMVLIDEQSIKNIAWDCAHVRLPKLSLEQQKRSVFAYGEKDDDFLMAKKNMPRKYPDAIMRSWKNHGHCTKIIQENGAYIEFIKELLKK